MILILRIAIYIEIWINYIIKKIDWRNKVITWRTFNRTLYENSKTRGALFPIFPLGFSGAEEAEKLGVVVSATQVRSSGQQLAELFGLLNDGTIQVVIDSVFTLSDARKAHESVALGNIQGKIVLTVD